MLEERLARAQVKRGKALTRGGWGWVHRLVGADLEFDRAMRAVVVALNELEALRGKVR